MCGIAGSLFRNVSDLESISTLDSLGNRGPDGNGVFYDNEIYLCHTRLSIIDLNDLANQPMVSPCGRYCIVFNGEIYNYRHLRTLIEPMHNFHTSSDTEVVLAYFIKYGVKALDFFRGMFSIAIWDRDMRELFIARDRLGVKPLFYAQQGGVFCFASRPTALFSLFPQLERSFCRQSIRYYVESGYIPAPFSIYENVRKLEPGHYLIVNAVGVSITQYWSTDKIETDSSLETAQLDDLLDQLDSLIDESVRLRMESDVPLGAFLSGGVDSSLVAAYMAKHSRLPIRTFTVGFKEKSYDESGYAEAVSKHLGTNHTCEHLAVDDLLKLMPIFIKNYDEPFFDYSAFPVMAVSRLARSSVTVSLSGDGGDEAFGGYHYYNIMKMLQHGHQIPSGLRSLFSRITNMSANQRIRWFGKVLAADGPSDAFAFMRGVIKDARNLMMPTLLHGTKPLASLFCERAEEFPSGLSYAEIGMRLDLAYTLPDDYLQKVDVGSMAFSLEAREPLLDHKIIEWSARLPIKWKISNGINKYLLRQLAYRHIPQNIIDRPKMGFGVPMASWLRGGLRDWAESLLRNDQAFEALELNAKVTRDLWNDHLANKQQAHTALWSILVLLQFYKNQVEC